MIWTKLPWHLLAFSAPLVLELVTISGFSTTAQAQTRTPTQINLAQRRKTVTFEPREDQPAPTYTVGGGKRGTCGKNPQASEPATEPLPLDHSLTPLLRSPLTDPQLTVSARPTFLVYVPQTSAKAVEFTLLLRDKNGSEKGIYQTSVNLTGTPGILSISLPATAPELEIGQDYEWRVVMACQTGEVNLFEPNDPFAEALIRRIQPDSSLSQIDRAKPLDRVALYAKEGVWFDAVANLAALLKSQPNEPQVASAWKELLQGAGLGEIAHAPLMN
jgi:hypothetical protein